MNALHDLRILQADAPLGAEVTGLDLSRPLPDDTAAAIRRALIDHAVIWFRGQRISQTDQVRFTSVFGRPVPHVREQPDRDIPEIFVVSNVTQDGKPIGALGSGELTFHSDLSYMPRPGTVSILYAVEVPRSGGATQWCDGRAAYDSLDPALKARIRGLRAVHRHYIEAQNPPEPASHPVATTHPESGRKALYVGPHLTKHIEGVSPQESRALLDALIAHATQPRFIYAHTWRAGDLVVWDNRSTMHRREPFPDTQRRLMWRTQIFNDLVPVE